MVPSLVRGAPSECVCVRLGGGGQAGVVHSLFMPDPQLAQEVTVVTLSTDRPALILIVLLLFIHGPSGVSAALSSAGAAAR